MELEQLVCLGCDVGHVTQAVTWTAWRVGGNGSSYPAIDAPHGRPATTPREDDGGRARISARTIDAVSDTADIDEVRAAYEASAPTYLHHIGTTVDEHVETASDIELLEQVAARLRDQAPGVVLDVGCGPGRVAAFLTTRGVATIGVDLSEAMLDAARLAHHGLPVVQGDLHRLPVGPGSVAGLMSWYSIIHTPPAGLRRVFAEFARVVRPDGVLVVAFQSGTGESLRRDDAYGTGLPMTSIRHDAARVADELERAGLTVESRRDRPAARSYETTAQTAFVASRRGAVPGSSR